MGTETLGTQNVSSHMGSEVSLKTQGNCLTTYKFIAKNTNYSGKRMFKKVTIRFVYRFHRGWGLGGGHHRSRVQAVAPPRQAQRPAGQRGAHPARADLQAYAVDPQSPGNHLCQLGWQSHAPTHRSLPLQKAPASPGPLSGRLPTCWKVWWVQRERFGAHFYAFAQSSLMICNRSMPSMR